MPDKVSTQIGRVINLIQTKMDEGLLIYSYQVLSSDTEELYCSLQTVIKSKTTLDCFVQACDYLNTLDAPTKLIGEAAFPKEKLPKWKQKGLGSTPIKLIDSAKLTIDMTCIEETKRLEARSEDEIARLKEALLEEKIENSLPQGQPVFPPLIGSYR